MSSRDVSKEEAQRRAKIRAEKMERQRGEANDALKVQQQRRDAELAKTSRLRALRLAKQAEGEEAVAAAQPKRPAAKRAASTARKKA